jgi:hypothetical protein
MRSVIRRLLTIAVVAVCPTKGVNAQTHHSASNTTAPVAAKPDVKIPVKRLDPADIALDRKIKGICRGS